MALRQGGEGVETYRPRVNAGTLTGFGQSLTPSWWAGGWRRGRLTNWYQAKKACCDLESKG